MRAIRHALVALVLLSSSLVAQTDIRRLKPALVSFHVKHDSSGALMVSWDQNRESDLAGYRVYQGTTSGSYDQIVNVGNVISWPVRDLVVEREYFFVVTAYDLSGNQSGFSAEASARAAEPTEILIPGALQISNLSRYSQFTFTYGSSAYSDRVYLIEDAGVLDGTQGVRTTNDDKFEAASDWVSFDVSEAADVVIFYDVGLSPPLWLSSSFSRAGFNVLVDKCGEYEAWIARFPAGRVQLGGNESPTRQSCMYLIAVRSVP